MPAPFVTLGLFGLLVPLGCVSEPLAPLAPVHPPARIPAAWAAEIRSDRSAGATPTTVTA